MPQSVVYDKIRNVIRKETPEVIVIYLFGSMADGSFNSESDFDLGILLPHDKSMTNLALFDTEQDFEY